MAAAVLAATLIMGPGVTEPPPLVAAVKETGPEPSAYTGKYYRAQDDGYRRCVAYREARYQYWTTGANGRYVGTYQFTRALGRGAVWMMAQEWRELYGRKMAREMREQLHATDPTKWSREVWDQAFWTVLNWRGPHSGRHHWAAQRSRCTPGMTWDDRR